MSAKRSLNILLITDGIMPFVIGGMQKHSFYLAKLFPQLGVQVKLVHCVPPGEPRVSHEQLTDTLFENLPVDEKNEACAHIQSVCLNFPDRKRFVGHYLRESHAYSEAVYDAIKDELNSYDFVYAKGFSAWKLLQEKKRGVAMPPIGVKFHGYEMYQKAPSLRVKLEHFLLRPPTAFCNTTADVIFSYGGKVTKLITELGISLEDIIEVTSGIEEAWLVNEPSLTKEEIKFVFLGRYERRKGIDELNAVIKELGTDQKFSIEFIGPIPEEHRLTAPHIIYHGAVMEPERVKKLLYEADCLLCPSHSEGMPNVILEGMARGLAVIATDVGAVSKMVSVENGWLISSPDPILLKEAMLKAIHLQKDLLMRKKEASLRAIKEQFTWEQVIKEKLRSMKETLKIKHTAP